MTDSSQRNETVITMAWPPVSESVLRVRLGVTVFCIVAVPRVTHLGLPLRRLIGYICHRLTFVLGFLCVLYLGRWVSLVVCTSAVDFLERLVSDVSSRTSLNSTCYYQH